MIADKIKYNIEPLGDHDRAAFSCGNASLDRYIREQASQDVKRGLASVFVITAKQVLAYYTLSRRELKLDQLPEENAKKVGKYGHVGVALFGRMAVTEKYKEAGLGALTLMNALHNSLLAATDVASLAVFIEAIDSDTANFYRKYVKRAYIEGYPARIQTPIG